MTIAQMFTRVRFITNTNSVTASDANLLRCLNEKHKQMWDVIASQKEGHGETSSTSNNLVAGTQNYALPQDVLKVKRIEVKYSSTGSWVKCRIGDLNEIQSATDSTTVSQNWSKDAPMADISGNNVMLYPIPDAAVSGGLKIWYVPSPTEFSATSETPTVPVEYHTYLADLVAMDVRLMKNEISNSQAMNETQAIWAYVKNQLSPRVTDQDQRVRPLYVNYG